MPCSLCRDLALGNRNGKKVYAVAPAVYASNLIFIIMQVVGLGGTQAMLAIRSVKMKKTNALICFVLSFIFMLGMGYLGSKFDDSSRMHWIAQVTNIVSQGTLLAGTMILHNAGLGK